MAKLTIKKEPSPNRVEGNKFDKIVKENLDALLAVLLKKFIGLQDGCIIENLPALKLQVTLEKEPDFLKKIRRKGSKKWVLLHGEFEAKDVRKTNRRMAFYVGLLHLIYNLEVEQHLFYLLEGKPKLITGLVEWDGYLCRFKIHCISDYSYLEFINSDIPEEVVLSVLANPEDKTGEEIIHLILGRLVQLRGNTTELSKFVNQLKILSILRKLRDETVKQISQMSLIIPKELIEADGLFIKGKEQGIEQGIEKQAIIAIANMLKEGFSTQRIADILDLEHEKVLNIQHQLKHREEIIEMLKTTKLSPARIAQKLGVSAILVEVLAEHKLY